MQEIIERSLGMRFDLFWATGKLTKARENIDFGLRPKTAQMSDSIPSRDWLPPRLFTYRTLTSGENKHCGNKLSPSPVISLLMAAKHIG